MMSFRGGKLASLVLPPTPVWLLGDIAESKGRELAGLAPGTP